MGRLIEIALAGTRNAKPAQRQRLLLVVEDGDAIANALQPICDFLDIAVERIPSEQDLTRALQVYRPMGVVANLDCHGQDGCHVMMTIAMHDRSLPLLLLIGNDAALAGAAEAVEELWQLQAVITAPRLPKIANIVDFLLRAGRQGHCSRLMRP